MFLESGSVEFVDENFYSFLTPGSQSRCEDGCITQFAYESLLIIIIIIYVVFKLRIWFTFTD